MIKGINCLSFPGGLDGMLDPFDAIEWAKQYGYRAAELCISEEGPCSLTLSETDCLDIKERAATVGIQLPSLCSGLYWSRSLGDSDAANRAQAKRDIEQMLQICEWLGAKTLLVIPGAVDVFFLPNRPPQTYDEVLANAKQGLKELLPAAEKHDVKLAIENVWNKFLLSPTEIRDFIDSFSSPFIGAYLDVGNVMPFGFPEQWIRILGNRIAGVHFKDFKRSVGNVDGFVDLLEGDVNWPEVVKALREVGYKGAVYGELIPGYAHHPMVRIANTSNAMDAILG